ncbi:MAG: hypothetical protein V4494_04140 [Chlamydiota bacterium]
MTNLIINQSPAPSLIINDLQTKSPQRILNEQTKSSCIIDSFEEFPTYTSELKRGRKTQADKSRFMAYSISPIGLVVDAMLNCQDPKQSKIRYEEGSKSKIHMITLILDVLETSIYGITNKIYMKHRNEKKLKLAFRAFHSAKKHAMLLHKINRHSIKQNSQIEETVKFLKKRITKLSKTESSSKVDILFSGGWRRHHKISGHSIMYGIHKDLETKTYTFHLWNTGAGIKKHHYSLEGKYELRASWSNLSFEQISSDKFLEKLVKFKKIEFPSKQPSNKIYDFINEYFQKEKDPQNDDLRRYRYKQPAYDCAWQSLWIPLSDLLGYTEDPELALNIKSDILTKLGEDLARDIAIEKAETPDPFNEDKDLILIDVIDSLKKQILGRIVCEATIKKLNEFSNHYEHTVKCMRSDLGRTSFYILSTIPGFKLTDYPYFSYDLKQTCLYNPEFIKKICTSLRKPSGQLRNLTETQFNYLSNICSSEEGMTAYQKMRWLHGKNVKLEKILNYLYNQQIKHTNIVHNEYTDTASDNNKKK